MFLSDTGLDTVIQDSVGTLCREVFRGYEREPIDVAFATLSLMQCIAPGALTGTVESNWTQAGQASLESDEEDGE
jgi:hypothetical protein